jgi:hypothetical protein
MGAAKDFIKGIRKERIKKSQDFAQQNLDAIKVLLEKYHPQEAAVILEHIQKYLQSFVSEQPIPLNLPKLDLGLSSLIFNNIALYLGNVQKVNALVKELGTL